MKVRVWLQERVNYVKDIEIDEGDFQILTSLNEDELAIELMDKYIDRLVDVDSAYDLEVIDLGTIKE